MFRDITIGIVPSLNLFSGYAECEVEAYDLEASAANYNDLLLVAVRAAYPGVPVHLGRYTKVFDEQTDKSANPWESAWGQEVQATIYRLMDGIWADNETWRALLED
jgi:hypothetical protein